MDCQTDIQIPSATLLAWLSVKYCQILVVLGMSLFPQTDILFSLIKHLTIKCVLKFKDIQQMRMILFSDADKFKWLYKK